jgi:hypothetical protein
MRIHLTTATLLLSAAAAYAEPPGGPLHNPQPKQCSASVPNKGAVEPGYYVMTVIYAPPGCGTKAKPCGKPSSVDYQKQSKAGTITTIGNSKKEQVSATIEAKAGGPIGPSLDVSATMAKGETTSTSDKEEVYKSENSELTIAGPSLDGIDHGHDAIYLMLNPVVQGESVTTTRWKCKEDITCECSGADKTVLGTYKHVSWTLSATNGTADMAYVYVDWLRHPSTMPKDLKARLEKSQLTEKQYAKLLEVDPLASGDAAKTIRTSKRFKQVDTTFAYEPPLKENDVPQATTQTLKNETISTKTYEIDVVSSAELKLTGSIGSPFASISVTADGQWQWTQTSSKGQLSDQAQQAAVTITEPSFGYTGPTDMGVYWDTVYNTFAFAPIKLASTERMIASGVIVDAKHAPAAFTEVTMKLADGSVRHAFTNSRGQYRMYGPAAGKGTVSALGAERELVIGKAATKLDLEAR